MNFINYISQIDKKGVPVTLNVKNEGEYQTFVGGCSSLVLLILTVAIFTAEFTSIFFDANFN